MGERVVTVGGNKATRPVTDFLVNVSTEFYVGPNAQGAGDDGRSGRSKETSLATIEAAIALCTASKNDIIYLLPGHAETLATAGAIALDKIGIRAIGLGTGALRPILTFSAVDATLLLNAASTSIENVIIKPSIDSVVSPIVVSAADCKVDVEVQDASSTVECVADILTTAGADRLTIKLKHIGFVTGDATVSAIQLVGVNDADIDVDFYGALSTAAGVVNMLTTVCTNIRVKGTFYVTGTTDLSKNVTANVGSCTWSVSGFDAAAGAEFSGGSGNAIAAGDLSAIASAVAVIDEYHDVPAANNTLNAQINEVIGNKTDTAAAGAVTNTDTLVGYIKQLVGEGISRDAVIGALANAAASGAVTDTDTLMAYIKQLVTQMGVEADTDPVSAVLSGAGGITTWKSGAVPATGVSIAEALRYFGEQVINGSGTALPSNTSLFGILAGATGVTTFPVPAAAADGVSLAEVEHYNQSLLRDLLGSALGIQDIGNIFYVDGGSTGPANDTGAGTSRSAPKKLFQSAYDLCASGNNDVVVVLNYGSAGRALEAWPIELSKDMVHIVGVGNDAQQWAAVCPPTGTAQHAFEVTGSRNTISNLCIAGGDGKAGIHVSTGAAPWGLLVRQCEFGVDNASATTQEGILIDNGGDAPYLTVLDNNFRGTAGAGGGLTGDHIKIAGNATRGRIGKPGKGNFFQGIANGKIGILLSGGAVGVAIEGNRFALEEDTKGMAITSNGSAGSCWINDNRAGENDDAITQVPYLETSSGKNQWGLNYMSITATMPATA